MEQCVRGWSVVVAVLLLGCLQWAAATYNSAGSAECVIELSCRECVPEGMPLVESHRAADGAVRAGAGAGLRLACRGTRFRAYPLRETLAVVCEAGRFRVAHDNSLRHLLELGCQDEIFEDVLHDVQYCAPPYQGRAYQTAAANGTRHLATLCFDADRALPRAAHAAAAALALPPHADHGAPRSLLGNFNQMFDTRTRTDAARLYSDSERLQRRVGEMLRHAGVTLGGQRLAPAALLAPPYFEDQEMRVSEFASNLVAVWLGVAEGNLKHLQSDVAAALASARSAGAPLSVWAGTHGVMSVRVDDGRQELFLQPGRFPVPKYLWTVVHDPRRRQAVALVLLNDPLVAVSEIRAAVFCESACARVGWLAALLRHRNYESPALGLVFCCPVHELAPQVEELPAAFADVPPGADGMLTDYPLHV